MIDSKADADKNKLSTDTISYSDIKNEAEWSAETKGVNYQKGDGVANKDKGLTPNFSGSKGEDDSTTKSAIAPGEIEIRSDEGKEEKDKTDLADLSRDPDKADKIFDKDKILEKQQAAALFGEIGFTLAGDLAAKMGWKEGSAEKVLLHGLIAGLMAEINGGKFGDGLTNGAINEMIIGLIADHQKELGLTGADTRWISALIGGAISEGMDGSFGQGAGITDSATKNNYLGIHDPRWGGTTADEWLENFCGNDPTCVEQKAKEIVEAQAILSGIYSVEATQIFDSVSYADQIAYAEHLKDRCRAVGLDPTDISNIRLALQPLLLQD